MKKERKDISEKMKDLYELLTDIENSNEKSGYEYYRWLVRNCERDYLHMLLLQLEKMNEDYVIKE